MEWTQCPQCGLVAEIVDRDVWPSTDGPIEHLHVRCVARHRFVLPAATLELHHLQHRTTSVTQPTEAPDPSTNRRTDSSPNGPSALPTACQVTIWLKRGRTCRK
jgi:hypothetical protein